MNEHRKLTIDLDPGADPIAGRIGPDEGPQAPFTGYRELIASLEQLRDGQLSDRFTGGRDD